MGNGKSKLKAVTLSQDLLEQLRCSLCKQYLSCPPIRLLPDGTSACGRCVTNPDIQVYRELTLEVTLSKALFPCRNRQFGCPETLQFGRAIDHESKCIYYPFECPLFLYSQCTWQGSVVQVREHVQKHHTLFVSSIPQIKLEINRSKFEAIMVINDTSTFLIKYMYESDTFKLKYDVTYFSSSAIVGSYKVRLINSTKPDNNVNLEGNRCLLYSSQNKCIEDGPILLISKFLEVLGNPILLTVEFDLPAIRPLHKFPKVKIFINYDLLESLRCPSCENYLTIPIFHSHKGTICADCSENNLPSRNEELFRLITTTNYPCRWYDCKFVGKGNAIRFHEDVCLFQPQKCPSKGCKEMLVIGQPTKMFHLLLHGYQFFLNRRSVYTSSFRFSQERNLVTVGSNNEIIAIKHKIIRLNTEVKHILSLHSCKSKSTTACVYVYFEHSHCRVKSRRFVCNTQGELCILANNLPKCFREHKKMRIIIEL